MKGRLAYLILLLFFVCSSGHIEAKSFEAGSKKGHEADMYAVLPFERQSGISNLLLTIHETIDKPIGYFPGLRDAPHQRFSWKRYGHRVFFHWGFNENPQNAVLLKQLVSECGWTISEESLFWQKVIKEQARRNRLVMSSVGGTLHFGMSGFERSYSNAFASIIYDVHLLGDYSTTMVAPLQPIDPILTDIQKAVLEKLRGGDLAKRFNKRLEIIKRSELSAVEKADRALSLMKEQLPKLILTMQDGYFKRHFERNALKLKRI